MGLMSVALDLLKLIHPMSNAQDELKEVSSSRQDLKNDMQDLEAAGFLKPCKETPDSWDFAQVPLLEQSPLPPPPSYVKPLHMPFAPVLVLGFAFCTCVMLPCAVKSQCACCCFAVRGVLCIVHCLMTSSAVWLGPKSVYIAHCKCRLLILVLAMPSYYFTLWSDT